MLRKLNFKVIFCLFVLVLPLTLSGLGIRAEEQEAAEESKRRALKIASWNIQNLGLTKAGIRSSDSAKAHKRDKTMGKIAEIIETAKIDLVAIQEYKDHGVEKIVKQKLLEKFPDNWAGIASSNTGGEKYLILYNEDIVKPMNPKIRIYEDWGIKMERLPGYCSFKTTQGSFDFTIITCHNRPWKKGAAEDADFLSHVYEKVRKRLDTEDNDIILLGDFNIEEDYTSIEEGRKGHFSELIDAGIKNTISFQEDTMVSESNESNLDNIFYLQGKDLELESSGVIRSAFIDKRVSDHYPVWTTFKIPEVDNDASEPE